MADIADLTNEQGLVELEMRQALSKPQVVVPRGKCLNCGEVLTPTAIYCDEYCKYDHERRTAC
jgi:uncharacterized OB-fold protein